MALCKIQNETGGCVFLACVLVYTMVEAMDERKRGIC